MRARILILGLLLAAADLAVAEPSRFSVGGELQPSASSDRGRFNWRAEARVTPTAKSADGRHDRQSTPFGHEHHAAALAAPITFEGVEVRDGRRLVGELGRAELDRRDAEYRVRLERFAALLTRRAGKER